MPQRRRPSVRLFGPMVRAAGSTSRSFFSVNYFLFLADGTGTSLTSHSAGRRDGARRRPTATGRRRKGGLVESTRDAPANLENLPSLPPPRTFFVLFFFFLTVFVMKKSGLMCPQVSSPPSRSLSVSASVNRSPFSPYTDDERLVFPFFYPPVSTERKREKEKQ